MNILHYIYDHINKPCAGGAYKICRRLSEKGHQVTIVSGKYPAAADYSEGNVNFRFVGNPKNYVRSTFSHPFQEKNIIFFP